MQFYLDNVKPEDRIAITGLELPDVDSFVTYLFDNTAFTS